MPCLVWSTTSTSQPGCICFAPSCYSSVAWMPVAAGSILRASLGSSRSSRVASFSSAPGAIDHPLAAPTETASKPTVPIMYVRVSFHGIVLAPFERLEHPRRPLGVLAPCYPVGSALAFGVVPSEAPDCFDRSALVVSADGIEPIERTCARCANLFSCLGQDRPGGRGFQFELASSPRSNGVLGRILDTLPVPWESVFPPGEDEPLGPRTETRFDRSHVLRGLERILARPSADNPSHPNTRMFQRSQEVIERLSERQYHEHMRYGLI